MVTTRLAEQGRDGEALMGLQRLRGGNAATAVAELMSLQTMVGFVDETYFTLLLSPNS